MNAIQDTIYYEIEDDKQSKKDFQKDEAILCIGSQTTHVTIEEKDIRQIKKNSNI